MNSPMAELKRKKPLKTARQLPIRRSGISLIEVMIALVIIGILASASLPSYLLFVNKQRRSDAQQLLMENASRLQRCLTMAGAYDAGCILMTESQEGHYELNPTLTQQTWSLTATPAADSPQTEDTECQTLTLDHTGNKSATGTVPGICWEN